MRKLVYYAFLIIGFSSFAQSDPINVPQIFPVSPEASNLGRFGEIPVNLAVGMGSFSVPIYTIEEPGFQLPISVNYQHNGLVIDQIPGHLGMGWSLSAGGMIARQMKGRPDEDSAGYIGANMTGKNEVIPYINNQLSDERKNEVNLLAVENLIDTQPDKFIANAGNMSVTFYFDENRNPVIKPYKPYVIELVNNDYSFNQGIKITDDNGIQYFFQEKERTTRTMPVPVSQMAGAMLDGYTSGWKLSKVILINNEEINFEYDATLHYQSTKHQSFTKWVGGDPNCSSSPLRTSTQNYAISSKIIKKITFPKGKIEFDNTTVTLPDNNENKNKYLSYLNKINVVNRNNKLINTYDFYFDNIDKTRKLLRQVRINYDTKNLYDFEYYGSPSDNIEFYKQDFWGYYNSNPEQFLINSYNTYDVFGARKPDLEKTRTGALKKISYPTKGYSEIEYELNAVETTTNDIPYTCQNAELEYEIFKTVGLNWQEQNEGESYDSEEYIFTIEEELQYIFIDMKVKKMADGYNNNDIYGKAKASITNINGSTVGCADIECYSGPPGANGCDGVSISIGSALHHTPGEKILRRRYKFKPGTYKLKVEVENYGVFYDRGDIIIAQATLHKEKVRPTKVEVGGLRISKIKNFPKNNSSECVEKEYIYENENEESFGKLFRKRNITKYRLSGTNTLTGAVCSAIWDIYSSSSNVPLGYFMGSHIFYDTVIERAKGNDDTYIGSTKKSFICSAVEQNLTFPFLDVDNKEFKNGKLASEEIYKNSSIDPISVTEYTYDFDGNGTPLDGVNQRVYSLKIGISYANNADGPNGYTSNNTVFRNNMDREWLITQTDTKVLEGSNIVSNKNYNYTNPQGHVKEEEVIDSKNNSYRTNYEYPYTLENTINNILISKNRLVAPIEITMDKNGDQLSKKLISHKEWEDDIISIEYIEQSKSSNPLETRLQYHDYDTYGNPIEVSKANGIHMVYIWGYDHKYPIAKIENATYADVSAYVTDIQIASDEDNDRTMGYSGKEGYLREVLDDLRNELPDDVMVTTYTYDPLIGVTSVKDPRGYIMYYEYDDFNRLEFVKDAEGKLLSENKYYYRHQ